MSIGSIAQALTPFLIGAFVAGPSIRMLFVPGQTGWKALSDLIRLAGTPAVLAAAADMDLPFDKAMCVPARLLAAAYGFYFVVTYYPAVRVSHRLPLTMLG